MKFSAANAGPQETAGRDQVKSRTRRLLLRVGTALAGPTVILLAAAGWLLYRSLELRTEMTAVSSLMVAFKDQLIARDGEEAEKTLTEVEARVVASRGIVTDPVWRAAGHLPLVGPNFTALTEIVLSTDDVTKGAAKPMLRVVSTLDWSALTPANGHVDVERVKSAEPAINSAAQTIDLTYARLSKLDKGELATQVSEPLSKSLESLDQLRQTLNLAADTSKLLPTMLGSQGERNYLLLLQNNAEVRATGGLPGALAVLQVENGNIRFATQSSGSSLGRFRPPISVDPEQTLIYTSRLGSYISDVNLTPDFPTAAKTAKSMWEERHGTRIDGVIALDAVALSHILKMSGPISVPIAQAHSTAGLPQTLTDDNVVGTLLSDVYKQLEDNDLQDAYFASATEAIFKVLASGKVPGQGLVTALTTSLDENRLRIWSDHKEEQELLYRNRVGGSIAGPSMGGATFGVYFNDGTGAKMDFYMKRTVQLTKQCPVDGYSEVKVRVTTSNTAPPDAATRLPAAVTGGGLHGIPPGTVQTNIIAYGPAQAHIETAHQDGVKTPFASYFDRDRPVGVLATKLQPGQSTTVEFTFGKIVQNEEPTLVMTPTVQPKDDVASSIVENCS